MTQHDGTSAELLESLALRAINLRQLELPAVADLQLPVKLLVLSATACPVDAQLPAVLAHGMVL